MTFSFLSGISPQIPGMHRNHRVCEYMLYTVHTPVPEAYLISTLSPVEGNQHYAFMVSRSAPLLHRSLRVSEGFGGILQDPEYAPKPGVLDPVRGPKNRARNHVETTGKPTGQRPDNDQTTCPVAPDKRDGLRSYAPSLVRSTKQMVKPGNRTKGSVVRSSSRTWGGADER